MTVGAVASQGIGRELFSFFRTPLPDVLTGDPADAPPIDPDSARIMARMNWEMPRLMDGSVPGRSFVWGPKLSPRAPLYRAGPASRTQSVPSNQDDSEYARTLLSNQGVPIPPGAVVAQPGISNDQNMSAWSPAEDKMWEGTGMKHSVDDMQFWAPVLVPEVATNAPVAGGSLTVGRAYFYRCTAVTDTGETGSNTVGTGDQKERVMLTIPTGPTPALQTAQLRIRPRWLIDAVNVYRCVATNGATLPPAPTGSPPDGQTNFYHRLSTTGIVYRWNVTTGVWDQGATPYPYAVGGTAADFGLLTTLLPAAHPNLFKIDALLYTFNDAGQYGVPNQAVNMPTISTATYDADTWRCDRIATVVNASACPGYSRDIAAGRPDGPQGRFWFGSATRISFQAGLITKRDWDRGEIDHVMNWSFFGGVGNNSSTPPNGWWHDHFRFGFPAQSSDGNRGDLASPPLAGLHPQTTQAMLNAGCPSNALPLPEGARFRLPANFDLDTIDTSALTAPQKKLCMMVARALKEYGIIATDTGAGVNIHCGWPCTEDPDDPAIAAHGSPRGRSFPDAEYDGRSGTTWRPGWPSEGAAFKPRKKSDGTAWDGPFPWDAMEVVHMGWGPDYRGNPADLSPCTTSSVPCPLGGP